MTTLEVLNGPEVGIKTEVKTETFFIGRDPNNHLPLSDRTVSRKHAVINQIEGKYHLSDLKSLKGVLVNGEKKGEAILQDGDEVAIGAVRLRFRSGRPEKIVLRKKRSPLWAGLILLVLTGAGVFFFFARRTPPTPPPAVDIEAVRENYEAGVRLFNGGDGAGARGYWELVLQLDPQKSTPYARKALKLLENIKE